MGKIKKGNSFYTRVPKTRTWLRQKERQILSSFDDKQTLKEIFKRAREKGWITGNDTYLSTLEDVKGRIEFWSDGRVVEETMFYYIFQHGFAKAFFGEDDRLWCLQGEPHKHNRCHIKAEKVYVNWKFHIQQMTVAESKMNYLKEFLLTEYPLKGENK